MPTRKIPKNYRSVTGALPARKSAAPLAFESTLERDFFLLCEFYPAVASVEEQPVRIEYRDETGGNRHYTPDALVTFQCQPRARRCPLLCEIKFDEDLRTNLDEFRPRFRVAREYARLRGWRFRVFTERVIRTPYLRNATFLLSFLRGEADPGAEERLLGLLATLRRSDPHTLLRTAEPDRWKQAELVPALWRLIGSRRIGCDLKAVVTMQSPIWAEFPRSPADA